MSKYGGILRGIQYTDERNRLAQEREDRLRELEYQRNRQATQDSQQAQLFEQQMLQFKQANEDRLREDIAYGFHSAITNNDDELFQKIWQKGKLNKMTGYDTILPVSEQDKQDMINKGIIKEDYNGKFNRFIKAIVKNEDGTTDYKYITKDSVAASVAGRQYTKLQQEQIANALAMQTAQLDLTKSALDVEKSTLDIKGKTLSNEKTKLETEKLKEEQKDPTKIIKTIEAKQKILATGLSQKVYKGEQVDVNTPEYNAALKGELSNIQNTKVQDELDGLNKATLRIQRANQILEKINNTTDQSFYDMMNFSLSKMKNLVTSYSDADYADQATKTEDAAVMQSYLERIGLESSLAGYLADLIKEQSGAAVNESEVQRKALELIGGNKYLINKETMKKAFSTHIEDVRGKVDRATKNSLYKQVAPLAYNKMQTILGSTNIKKERKPLDSFLGGN